MAKILDLIVPIYEQTLTVIEGDVEDALAFLETKLLPEFYEETSHRIQGSRGYSISVALPSGANHYVLWFETLEDLDVLVHECLHICFYILEDVGVHADAGHQEAIAYLQSWMFREIVQRLPNTKEFKRNKNASKRASSKHDSMLVSDGLARSVKRTRAR